MKKVSKSIGVLILLFASSAIAAPGVPPPPDPGPPPGAPINEYVCALMLVAIILGIYKIKYQMNRKVI